MQRYFILYFVCFTIGVACLGVTLVLATRTKDRLARSFLWLYVALTVMVLGALLRAFVLDGPSPVAPSTRFAIEYLDSIVGLYGMLLTMPLFAHRVFAVEQPWRDRLIVGLVLGAAAIQHLTEYVVGGVWDDRGDLLENVFTAAGYVYVLWLGFSRFRAAGVYRPLAVRSLALLSISLPALAHDLFANDDTGLRFYPLLYCVASVLITWTLMRRRSSIVGATIPADWGLSEREAEVARLVAEGLSNKAIADRLHISLNTVKTHLRAVFDKGGVSSRFELISKTRVDSSR